MRLFVFIFTVSILANLSISYAKEKGFQINEKVNSVYQAIVRIEVVSERGSNGRMLKSGSTGSGVIIDKTGLVVTNHHVAGKATRLTCRMHNGEEIGADLLGADALTDLAVLRLRLSERSPASPPLIHAQFGDSDKVRVGDTCFAMGSPAGLSQSVTRGIISNLALISSKAALFGWMVKMWGNWFAGLDMMRLSSQEIVEVLSWMKTA